MTDGAKPSKQKRKWTPWQTKTALTSDKCLYNHTSKN